MAVKADGVDLSATTAANVGQAGSSGGTYSVVFTNRGTSSVTVRLGLGTGSATFQDARYIFCLLYTSPSPRDLSTSRMPSSA